MALDFPLLNLRINKVSDITELFGIWSGPLHQSYETYRSPWPGRLQGAWQSIRFQQCLFIHSCTAWQNQEGKSKKANLHTRWWGRQMGQGESGRAVLFAFHRSSYQQSIISQIFKWKIAKTRPTKGLVFALQMQKPELGPLNLHFKNVKIIGMVL